MNKINENFYITIILIKHVFKIKNRNFFKKNVQYLTDFTRENLQYKINFIA